MSYSLTKRATAHTCNSPQQCDVILTHVIVLSNVMSFVVTVPLLPAIKAVNSRVYNNNNNNIIEHTNRGADTEKE